MVTRSAASVSPGNSLGMQILRHHPRLTESETWGWNQAICFNRPSRWLWWIFKFEYSLRFSAPLWLTPCSFHWVCILGFAGSKTADSSWDPGILWSVTQNTPNAYCPNCIHISFKILGLQIAGNKCCQRNEFPKNRNSFKCNFFKGFSLSWALRVGKDLTGQHLQHLSWWRNYQFCMQPRQVVIQTLLK